MAWKHKLIFAVMLLFGGVACAQVNSNWSYSAPAPGGQSQASYQGNVVVLGNITATGSVSSGTTNLAGSALSSIASLRANSASGIPGGTVNVSGYNSPGDLGAGQFTYVPSDTTSSDNGGTIIVDAAGRRWYRVNPANILTPQMFGAYCDNGHDDAIPIQNMAAAANNPAGNHIVFPAGQCLISSGFTLSQPFVLEGAAPGLQSSGAAYAPLVSNFATGAVINVTTSQAFTIKHFGIRAATTRTSGPDIVVNGDGTNVPTSFLIDGVTFNGSFTAISIPYGHHWTIRNCNMSSYGYSGGGNAIYYPSTGHADDGDNVIVGNTFQSGVSGTTNYGFSAVYLENTFAVFIGDNKFFGSQYGINAQVKASSGNLIVHNNSFEQQAQNHILIQQATSGQTIGNVSITGNEFSQLTSVTPAVNPTTPPIQISQGLTVAYVTNLSIASNIFNMNFTGTQSVVAIGDGTGTTVNSNVFNLYNVAGPGDINVFGNATNIEINDNIYNNQLTSQHYKNGLTTGTRVRDMNLHFADVGGWGNGSMLYVVDGTPGATLAGSGTGAWARRVNSVWNAN